MKFKFSNPFIKLSAGVSAYLMAANAHAAPAGPTVGSMATNIAANVWQFTDAISTAAVVVGTGFGMAGVYKLKQHAESPGNVSINAGLGRIAAGAGLIGLPFVINSTFNTLGVSDQATGTGVTGSSLNRFNQ
jgi:hypothetical protein